MCTRKPLVICFFPPHRCPCMHGLMLSTLYFLFRLIQKIGSTRFRHFIMPWAADNNQQHEQHKQGHPLLSRTFGGGLTSSVAGTLMMGTEGCGNAGVSIGPGGNASVQCSALFVQHESGGPGALHATANGNAGVDLGAGHGPCAGSVDCSTTTTAGQSLASTCFQVEQHDEGATLVFRYARRAVSSAYDVLICNVNCGCFGMFPFNLS